MRYTPPPLPPPPPPSSSAPKASWQWDSPLPYLFAGLGLMLLLITASLIVLACSYRKRRQSPPSDLAGEKAVQLSTAVTADDGIPKVVVIMAGEENPTHLAIPIKV